MATRKARVELKSDLLSTVPAELNVVKRYLPGNYRATISSDDESVFILIEGQDDHGWTLDGYVIPRLGTGLIVAKEISSC